MSLYLSVRGASKRAQTVAERIRGKKFNREQAEVIAKPRQYGAWRHTLDQTILSGMMPPIIPQALVPKWNKIKAAAARRTDWKKIVPRHVVQEIFKACTTGKTAAWENVLKKFKERCIHCIPSMLNVKNHSVVPPCLENVRPPVFLSFKKAMCSKIVTPKSGFLKSRSYYHTGSLPEVKPRSSVPMIHSTDVLSFPLISRRLMETASSSVRFSNTMVTTERGITIKLNTTGYMKENITVEVESGWLVIEALSTASEDGGGYLQRHMMRRYELPPHSDIQNIKVELNEQTKELRVTVPSMKPKSKTHQPVTQRTFNTIGNTAALPVDRSPVQRKGIFQMMGQQSKTAAILPTRHKQK